LHFIAILIRYKSMRSTRGVPVTPIEESSTITKLNKLAAYIKNNKEGIVSRWREIAPQPPRDA